MRTHHPGSIAALLLLHLALPAGAQDAKKPPASEFNADLGFVNVSGNTAVTTLNVGEKWIRRLAPWEFRQDFGIVYGETDGQESSNSWRASLRGDFGLSSRVALYLRGGFDRDKFAGITSRFAEGAGGVLKVLATDVDQFDVQAGYELTQQETLDGTDTFSSLRAASTWKHALGAKASFFQSVEFLPNLDDSKDLRVNSETTVVAPLSAHIGMKVSYLVRFDNQPALNAAGTTPLLKSDRILSTGIQISF